MMNVDYTLRNYNITHHLQEKVKERDGNLLTQFVLSVKNRDPAPSTKDTLSDFDLKY